MELIIIAACAVMFICGIVLLVEAFSESVLWGLAYLFIPFASLVFIATHWQRARTAVLVALGALAVMLLASAAAGP